MINKTYIYKVFVKVTGDKRFTCYFSCLDLNRAEKIAKFAMFQQAYEKIEIRKVKG
jgi:hypothetical protein